MRWAIILLVVTGFAWAAHAQMAPPPISEADLCSTLDEIAAGPDAERATRADQVRAAACRLPVDDIDPVSAEAALDGRPIHVQRASNTLTIIARSERDEAHLCCSLQAPMSRIGDSAFVAARFRLADLDRAMLFLFPPDRTGGPISNDDILTYRGPDAPPAPELETDIEGRIVETTLWSPELQETRKLVIYLPPEHGAGGDYATLVVADGSSVSYYGRMIEPMIDRGEIEPLVLVGVESGQSGIVEDRSHLNLDLRAADYLPGWEGAGDRFELHLRFVAETLLPFAEREYGITRARDRRGVAGFSNGGVFAYIAALRRPDLFGIAIARSTGFSRAEATVEELTNPLRARFFMSAGLYETSFWRSTHARAEALRAAGYDVTFLSMAAGHAPDQGNYTLAEFVRSAFPPRQP